MLSVGQLAEKHSALPFKDQLCTVFDSHGDEMFIVEMKNYCYPLNLAGTTHLALYNEHDLSETWHRILGHVNYTSLSLMVSKGIVEGLLAITKPNKLCQTY